MNKVDPSPITINSIDDLIIELSEGERTTFNEIFRSTELSQTIFEDYCSWSDQWYTRNCIWDNEDFELILICWGKGHITPIHDHGGEECWVKVIKGKLKENIYQKNDLGEMHLVKSVISSPEDISYMRDFMGFHSLQNVAPDQSMTLHLYAKPIRNCRIYDEESKKFTQKKLTYHTQA